MCEPLPRRTPNRRFTLTYVSRRIARLPVFALINAFTTLALLARSAYYVIADTIFALLARSAYYGLALIFNAFFTTGA